MHVYNTKEKIMLIPYIDERKSCKKNLIVLSTIHDHAKITKHERKKPRVHTMYNQMKGSIDVDDLLSATHSKRIKPKRRPLNALAFNLSLTFATKTQKPFCQMTLSN